MLSTPSRLSAERCFSADPAQRAVARALYDSVKHVRLICPHGHVPPELLANPAARLGSPAELFIIPDHYIFRMLYSQGMPLEELGIATRDGSWYESDHRKIWQRFAEQIDLFRATPTGLWLADELQNLFGITERLDAHNAQQIYDQLVVTLAQPEFTPRALIERFQIDLLTTTDPATDSLEYHRSLHAAGFDYIRPTFRPDAVVNIANPGWREQIGLLSQVSGVEISDFSHYLQALEQRRVAFKQLGALATDHGVESPYSQQLHSATLDAIFERALQGLASTDDAAQFTGHMLIEFARMSSEDGLVMQLHAGSLRNHNTPLFERFGADKGADIPVATEWTRNLRPLLNAYGNDPRFRLILFTLDESSYSRELAPLAGHYPAVLLGPPWWFFDSVHGMQRYFERVVETAGLANTAGFNDDTRAFASIPSRHDLWRRVSSNWLAGLVVTGLLDEDQAFAMAYDCAYGLAKRAYRFEKE